jgi:hypothetical protein
VPATRRPVPGTLDLAAARFTLGPWCSRSSGSASSASRQKRGRRIRSRKRTRPAVARRRRSTRRGRRPRPSGSSRCWPATWQETGTSPWRWPSGTRSTRGSWTACRPKAAQDGREMAAVRTRARPTRPGSERARHVHQLARGALLSELAPEEVSGLIESTGLVATRGASWWRRAAGTALPGDERVLTSREVPTEASGQVPQRGRLLRRGLRLTGQPRSATVSAEARRRVPADRPGEVGGAWRRSTPGSAASWRQVLAEQARLTARRSSTTSAPPAGDPDRGG